MIPDVKNKIFGLKDQEHFNQYALEIFRFQSAHNPVYREFLKNLNRDPLAVDSPDKIPFLPVGFFKSHIIMTGGHTHEKIFESSGTSGSVSRHYLADIKLYEQSFLNSFMLFYGDPADYMMFALLPSYTERGNSSLVYMIDNLIRKCSSRRSGFYRDDPGAMFSAIEEARKESRKILLMGVSFALADLAENHPADLHDVLVMETGGMKGRRKEMTRQELHEKLINAFNVRSVHSEYGMTELLSQAYSDGNGLFRCPPWMKIFIRDPQDPLTILTESGITGGINIVDLANINSCSFIAAEDLGRLHPDGSFEVLGRLDNSDIRGCNLMIEQV